MSTRGAKILSRSIREPQLHPLWEAEEAGTTKNQSSLLLRSGVGEGRGPAGFDGWWRLNTFLNSSAILTSFPALPFPAKLCFLQKLLLGFLFQKRAAQAALHFRHLWASKRAKASLLISCYGNKHCRGTENAMQVTLGEPEP